MLYQTIYPSPLGRLTLAADGDYLVGLWLDGQKYHGSGLTGFETREELPVFDAAKAWLTRYFGGERPAPGDLPLKPAGSEFRQQIWQMLCAIPYGEVTTYGALARRMAALTGRNMSGQAIGGAVGHNPISIIIPCHRVVGSDGSLTGYAGGVAAKVKLLEHEGVDTQRLSVPRKGTAL